ncbi:MAG: MFS transporter [Thermoanaerobaculales bacterium]|jgi:predicted MFS family arabinose efflux permease|nr:MFS transporter [Thermoanaerobaculales bacterium]
MTRTSDLASRRWLVLFASVFSFFAIGATFFVVPPLIPELVDRFDLSNFEIGLLMGAISFPAVFLAVPVGLAVDRWQPRKAGLAGLSLMLVGAVSFATAPSFAILFAGRFFFGIGGLVVNLLLARLLTEAFAERELALAMGIFMATYPASMITVFSLQPALLGALGWRGELLVLAGLVALAIPLFVIAVGRAGKDRQGEAGVRPSLRINRSLVALAIGWMLFFGVHVSVLTFGPKWAGGGSAALLVVTLVMWVAMVGSPLVGVLIDRSAGPARWLVAGHVVQAVVVAAMAAGILPPTAAMLGVGVAAALLPTAAYALPGLLVAPERVGFAFGFITAFSNLGTIVGPAIAGALLDARGSFALVWTVLAALAAAAIGVAAFVRPRSV